MSLKQNDEINESREETKLDLVFRSEMLKFLKAQKEKLEKAGYVATIELLIEEIEEADARLTWKTCAMCGDPNVPVTKWNPQSHLCELCENKNRELI